MRDLTGPRYLLSAAVAGAMLLLSVSSWGGASTPLANAVERQDKECVRSLLDSRADVHSAQPDGMTPLHWAAHLDDFETAKLLVKAGTTVKAENQYGVTPLSLACVNG